MRKSLRTANTLKVSNTEGKSLIFYAFDLGDKKHVKTKSTFQAWGQTAQVVTNGTSTQILWNGNAWNANGPLAV